MTWPPLSVLTHWVLTQFWILATIWQFKARPTCTSCWVELSISVLIISCTQVEQHTLSTRRFSTLIAILQKKQSFYVSATEISKELNFEPHTGARDLPQPQPEDQGLIFPNPEGIQPNASQSPAPSPALPQPLQPHTTMMPLVVSSTRIANTNVQMGSTMAQRGSSCFHLQCT